MSKIMTNEYARLLPEVKERVIVMPRFRIS